MSNHRAFTLIELLVVVAIIAILLALLMPALDKAVYQATLVQCAGKQKAVTGAIISYAYSFARRYPSHGVENFGRLQEDPAAPLVYVDPMTLADTTDAQSGYDMRPQLKGYVQVNAMLQCPFNIPAELEKSPPDAVMEASYMMFWGWQYQPTAGLEKGMFKFGDRFAYTFDRNDAARKRVATYNTLIGDIDLAYNEGAQASHPDKEPRKLGQSMYEGGQAFGVTWYFSRWMMAGRDRGRLDSNWGYDDGSVSRMTDISDWTQSRAKLEGEGMDRIPLQYDDRRNSGNYQADKLNIPRR